MKTFHSRFVSNLFVFGFLMTSGNVLIANMKTMNGMDDVPPTNPTRTNRFPSTYTKPESAPTPKGKVQSGGTTGVAPTATPTL